MSRPLRAGLVRAALLTAVVDFVFASSLNVAYGSTVARVWQGVAFTVLGPRAMQGGAATVALGLLMHCAVAFFWTTLMVMLLRQSDAVREAVAGKRWILVAAVYGPLIWLMMSLAVIPALVGRPPTINMRWWINLVAHVPFVTIPMLWSLRRG